MSGAAHLAVAQHYILNKESRKNCSSSHPKLKHAADFIDVWRESAAEPPRLASTGIAMEKGTTKLWRLWVEPWP